jgi:4-carboxymuconolactone decarboxylase
VSSESDLPAGAIAAARTFDAPGDGMMTSTDGAEAIVPALDEPTRLLVRASAAICGGTERQLRSALAAASAAVDSAWVEEVVLQSYLFAGLPRALNAAREWRRISGRAAPHADEGADYANVDEWRRRGEETCATVYGRFYERLRRNIAELHPALDTWMIVEGYGKVLGREALDLRRRELCVVAACAALGQDRQLHSHLHGALHAGASEHEVEAVLAAVADFVRPEDRPRFAHLWSHVRGR